jgi:hypothetical protein
MASASRSFNRESPARLHAFSASCTAAAACLRCKASSFPRSWSKAACRASSSSTRACIIRPKARYDHQPGAQLAICSARFTPAPNCLPRSRLLSCCVYVASRRAVFSQSSGTRLHLFFDIRGGSLLNVAARGLVLAAVLGKVALKTLFEQLLCDNHVPRAEFPWCPCLRDLCLPTTQYD